jgi:hypothetical protein
LAWIGFAEQICTLLLPVMDYSLYNPALPADTLFES